MTLSLRKKGIWKDGEAKYVIDEDRRYLKTLPPLKDLIKLLCLEKTEDLCLAPTKEECAKVPKKFAYELLSEPPKQDTIEEAKRKVDSLMREMLEGGNRK